MPELEDIEPTGYFPTRAQLAMLRTPGEDQIPDTFVQFAPGAICRTDGLPVDQTLGNVAEQRRKALAHGDFAGAENLYGLFSRMASVSDLTPALYDHFCANATSIANWYPALYQALASQGEKRKFCVPQTTIARLPVELAQFTRIEYASSTPASRAIFNDIIFNLFGLEDGRTYFIKTGTFSSKFEFANAKCSEPREMGEYFQAINNFAMMVGAGDSVDLCVRDYIEANSATPTIYHGMPLRPEFRVFVDLDADEVLGITPYWHPSVMRNALAASEALGMDYIRDDAKVYEQRLPYLTKQFEAHRDTLVTWVKDLIPGIDLSGCWSLDIMLEADEMWLIDMAEMHRSALADVLLHTNEYSLVGPQRLRKTQERPEVIYPPQEGSFGQGAAVEPSGVAVRRYPAIR